MLTQVAAAGCLGWCAVIAIVTTIGTVQIYRHYSRHPRKPVSSHLQISEVPHVTIIRPCKGLEPFLYDCLAATFHQDYPSSKVTLHFCVSSRADTAYEVLQRLQRDFPQHESHIFVEEEDPIVQEQDGRHFGPNPKIRNMSRAYREAKGDVVWILDCNIWVGYGALGRMVDKLCGFTAACTTGQQAQTAKPYKLVAHLPVCIDVDGLSESTSRHRSTSVSASDDPSTVPFLSSNTAGTISGSEHASILTGSMLETSFLSTAHAKMYVAINSVSIAPCINGKSTMFRISHLNYLTHDQGIDHFSTNICEDHLIGDLLWRSHIPATLNPDRHNDSEDRGETTKSNPRHLEYRNHGLAVGDLAIQPVSGMSVTSYIARRVRWLRVRKFTVMLATLVEPGTESILCCMMGAFAVTTLKVTRSWFGSSWTAMTGWFVLAIGFWGIVDFLVSGIIQGMGSVEIGSGSRVPIFARPTGQYWTRSSKWLVSWLGRESLALAVWTWAIWGGTTVTWREKKFWVGMDMRVHEIPDRSVATLSGEYESNGRVYGSTQTSHVAIAASTSQNGRGPGKVQKAA